MNICSTEDIRKKEIINLCDGARLGCATDFEINVEYENRKLDTLSKGNQQKVQLAQTLLCNPELIILDEPFSGLDPVNAQILKDVIKEQIQEGKLVIFSSHQMSYVEEFCDDIAILNHGNVVLGGDLKDIKREFGRDCLVVSSIGQTPQELAEIFKNHFLDLLDIEKVFSTET